MLRPPAAPPTALPEVRPAPARPLRPGRGRKRRAGSSTPPASPLSSQLLPGVLADGLEHPVAHRTARGRRPATTSDLSTRRTEQVQDVVLLDAVTEHTASAASSVQPPANTESLPEQPLLRLLGEQVVAPVHRRPAASAAAVRRPGSRHRARSSESSSLCGDLLHRKRPHPGRRELYGQRYAVQPPAHLRHRARVLPVSGEARQPQCGARSDEEPARLRSSSELSGGGVRVRRPAGRGAAPARWPRPRHPRASRLVARTVRRGHEPRSAVDQSGRCVHEVLAVVQTRSSVFPCVQVLGERLERADVPGCSATPRASATAWATSSGSESGGELAPATPRPGRRPTRSRGHLQGEPRLARAARAGEGQEPGHGQERLTSSDLALSAHEAGPRNGQVVPRTAGCSRRRSGGWCRPMPPRRYLVAQARVAAPGCLPGSPERASRSRSYWARARSGRAGEGVKAHEGRVRFFVGWLFAHRPARAPRWPARARRVPRGAPASSTSSARYVRRSSSRLPSSTLRSGPRVTARRRTGRWQPGRPPGSGSGGPRRRPSRTPRRRPRGRPAGTTGATRPRRPGSVEPSRTQRPAGDVNGSPQVVRGRFRAQIGPEEVHRPLAVEPVARSEGEQLHQARRLPQPPGVLLDGPAAHRDDGSHRAARSLQPRVLRVRRPKTST